MKRAYCPFCEEIVALKPVGFHGRAKSNLFGFILILILAVQAGLLYFTVKFAWGKILPDLIMKRSLSMELGFSIGAVIPFLLTALIGGAIGWLFVVGDQNFYKCEKCDAVNENGVWSNESKRFHGLFKFRMRKRIPEYININD